MQGQQSLAPGTVVINSAVEVEVFVDRQSVGITRSGRLEIQLSPGTHIIDALRSGYEPVHQTISLRSGERATISFRLVPQLSPEPARLTGRALLPQGADEESGYGLYSYLLLAHRVRNLNSKTYSRYLAAIEAYLEIEAVNDVLKYEQRKNINVTYVPVVAPYRLRDPAVIVQYYDYARAQRILRVAKVQSGDGPFIIGTPQPLSRSESLPRERLIHDLSTVPDRAIRAWVRLFLLQASQEKFWERMSREEFLLRLRTEIARSGDEVDKLRAAFASVIWRFNVSVDQ